MCLYKQEARNQNLFCQLSKKKQTPFLAFWEHCQRHHPELFFSRILILHEKKEEKNYVKSDMTKKKNPTLSYVINMFLLASSDFFESLFPMALCVIL